jgi:hypothetical protein
MNTFKLVYAPDLMFQNNTVCEEIDLSDNYVEGTGAFALADMLKENMFVVNLVSQHNHTFCI